MQEAKGPKVRQFDRVGIDLYINKIIGDEPHLARVRDISVGGVYLYKLLEPEMEHGTRVGLELMLPGHDEVIWALGEVVREDEAVLSDGTAVRFIRITEHDRQAIRDFVGVQRHVEEVEAKAA